MSKYLASLALILAVTGCRTPTYLGGEFMHRGGEVVPAPSDPPDEGATSGGAAKPADAEKGRVETFVYHDRWVFFWGLLGTEKIDIPEQGGGFNCAKELAGKFADNEHLVDLTVEAGTTVPGIVTGFFTIGIVQQRDVAVKARRIVVGPPPPEAPSPPAEKTP
jgi:hypothetical protein